MATVMSWGDNSGTRGRCDNHCHSAKLPKCVCMCGGRFHGSANKSGGVEQAVRDTWDEVLNELAKKEGLELETDRWAKNRERILSHNPAPIKANCDTAMQGRLPLEVA